MSQSSEHQKATFHWGEGNKFAVEFAKSLFLFNSSISIALIGFVGATKHESAELARSIAFFIFVSLISMLIFGFGYIINLHQGNSYLVPDSRELWLRSGRLQNYVYILLAIIVVSMLCGFGSLFFAAREYAATPLQSSSCGAEMKGAK
jgi:hypothetical protein